MSNFEQLIVSAIIIKSPQWESDVRRLHEQLNQSRENFPKLVAKSSFHFWEPGMPIQERGLRYLVGVSVSSRYDMRLLDQLEAVLSSCSQGEKGWIDTFDCDYLQSMEELRQYIPELTIVHSTPFLGVWENGVFVQSMAGADAKNYLKEMFLSGQ
jgi:hypothetical protein